MTERDKGVKVDTPIVQISGVSFAYNRRPVLEDVNLDIPQGDFIAMIGPNGGGKTTLLKLILGLIKPDRGDIRLLGQPPQRAASNIGYVPQNVNMNHSFPISAMDVVLMGKLESGKPWGRKSAAQRREALAALERLDIAAYARERIGELSGGQRQRVFIARALVTNPKLLLLDEPTTGIDSKGQADFYKLLRELNRHITILVVSHDLLAISRYVKSVACVNRYLHYHAQAEITGDMLEAMYPCTQEETCPVELVAHGLPHRVLKDHYKQ